MLPEILLYIIALLLGVVIGRFLNGIIEKLLQKENGEQARVYTKSCEHKPTRMESIPVLGYLAVGGKCPECKEKLSVTPPLVEGACGVLYLAVVARFGFSVESLLYCLLFSALLALSVIDFRTYEIPVGFNYFILALGLVRVFTDLNNWLEYAIGLIAVSAFLCILYYATRGRAIGGGDVKLMASTGLLIGWKLSIVAFLSGCILGSVIHIIRMKVSGEEHVLAMGPYLAAGVALAVMFGNEFLRWYLGSMGIMI